MTDPFASEYAYRTITAVLVIWLFLLRMYYEENARWPRRPRPAIAPLERTLVALTSLWLLPVLLYVFTTWLDPYQLDLPHWLRKAGAVVMSFGVLLFWYAHAVLGRNWSPFLEIKPHHELVIRGPYQWVRHPMYLANFTVGIGLALVSANWLIVLVYFLPVIALYVLRVRAEENMLLAHFGQPYRAYQARTGRLLPRLNKDLFRPASPDPADKQKAE